MKKTISKVIGKAVVCWFISMLVTYVIAGFKLIVGLLCHEIATYDCSDGATEVNPEYFFERATKLERGFMLEAAKRNILMRYHYGMKWFSGYFKCKMNQIMGAL